MSWLMGIVTWVKSHVLVSIIISIVVVGGGITGVVVLTGNKEELPPKVEENKNNDTVVLKDNLKFEINSEVTLLSLISDDNKVKILSTDEKIDTSMLGEKEVTIKYQVEEKEQEEKVKINIVDTTPPIIEFKKELSTTTGTKIDLLKDVKVTDNSKEDIKATIEGNYDINKVDTYKLKYVAVDSSNNRKEEEFVLKVNKKETSTNNNKPNNSTSNNNSGNTSNTGNNNSNNESTNGKPSKLVSTVDRINLNDNIKVKVHEYGIMWATMRYGFATNVKEIFGNDYNNSSELESYLIEDFDTKFSKLNFDTTREESMKNTLNNMSGSGFGYKGFEYDFSNHLFRVDYQYLELSDNKIELKQLEKDFNSKIISTKLDNLFKNSITVYVGAMGLDPEPVVLNESLCSEYKLTCGRW